MKSTTILVPWSLLSLGSVTHANPKPQRPSENFRKEHVQIREHLDRASGLNGTLEDQPGEEQRTSMRKITTFLKERIKPHAEWKERVLYRAVDKRAGNQTHLFTATMRNDHKIIGRWINDLEIARARNSPDLKDFVRKTDRLLGLIAAHFENEEDVLLHVLDKRMSAQEFDREIMAKSPQ